MSAIKSRDIRTLDIEGLRALVRQASYQREDHNTGDKEAPLDAQAVLDLWWAAADKGYADGFEDLVMEAPEEARSAMRKAERGSKARAKKAKVTQ